MPESVTAPQIRAMRQKGKRSVWVTAYDSVFGSIADEAGVDVVLVGDSVGNVLLGYENTLPVTLDMMVHHTRAVRAGVKRALVVSDLPFGSYQLSVRDAVEAAVTLARHGAQAVKLEGGYTDEITACVRAGIPTAGHLGMTPQSVNVFGGHRVQGRGDRGDEMVTLAKQLEEAGAFAIVLELIPAELAQRITDAVTIPTIGIGAGVGCTGQVQVLTDVLGLTNDSFKHARAFVRGRNCLLDGLRDYADAVRDGSFPTEENSF